MIKALRRKFILTAMCSIFAVLLVIISVILVSNYVKIVNRSDELLRILVDNGGTFPKNNEKDTPPGETLPDQVSLQTQQTSKFQGNGSGHFTPETPFETRFFSVKLDENGTVSQTELGNIAAIAQADAVSYADAIWKSGRKSGFYQSYRYLVAEDGASWVIYFVDCSRDLNTYHGFLITSISVSFLGIALVFLLVFFTSKLVFKPVAESYEKQKQFITDASHELKTPLTIIDANTEVLEMMEGESEWTASTRKQVKRLAALTQQMVTLSRMDEGNSSQSQERFCISDTVADVAEPFVLLAETKGKSLSLKIEKGMVYLGEEDLIRQLVSILLDNAVKYSTPQGEIRLSLFRKGKKIQLQVSNPVEQMDPGSQNILFERFYRTDQSRNSETGGSGIGLSIAKAIVEGHKGKITAYNPDGKSLNVTAVL